MQLSLSLSSVLGAVFLILSMHVVDAAPSQRRATSLVTLPLKRMEQKRSAHPQIELQQNINRSLRRLARMTGQSEPSRRELLENLERRVASVEETLEKRFNRIGVPRRMLEKRFNRYGVPEAAPGGASLASGDRELAQKSSVKVAGDPTAENSLGLDIEAQDIGYLATVQIGTPPRDFLVLMDSGSADFWVGSENCASQAGGGCGNHQFLGTKTSSSFVDSAKPFQVTYGTGQVKGTIVKDDINLGGLALKGHVFGVADEESVEFSSNTTPFDGLMGLAQSTLSEQKTLTPVEALAAAKVIPDSVVSYKISRLADNKNDGEITFGGLDPTKFDSAAIVTVPNLSKTGFWEAALDAATVDGVDSGLTGRTAILDTGTTLMVLPAADASAIHKGIKGAKSDGQGGFTVPCDTKSSVALTFGGQVFTIDPRDIAITPVDPADPTGDCISGIASGQVGGATEWLVGDVFLKNAYFSTDVSTNTLSLAKLA